MYYCVKCGNQFQDDERFCIACGAPIAYGETLADDGYPFAAYDASDKDAVSTDRGSTPVGANTTDASAEEAETGTTGDGDVVVLAPALRVGALLAILGAVLNVVATNLPYYRATESAATLASLLDALSLGFLGILLQMSALIVMALAVVAMVVSAKTALLVGGVLHTVWAVFLLRVVYAGQIAAGRADAARAYGAGFYYMIAGLALVVAGAVVNCLQRKRRG